VEDEKVTVESVIADIMHDCREIMDFIIEHRRPLE